MTPGWRYALWERWFLLRSWFYDSLHELSQFRLQIIRPTFILSGLFGVLLLWGFCYIFQADLGRDQWPYLFILWLIITVPTTLLGWILFEDRWLLWPRKPIRQVDFFGDERKIAQEVDQELRERMRIKNSQRR